MFYPAQVGQTVSLHFTIAMKSVRTCSGDLPSGPDSNRKICSNTEPRTALDDAICAASERFRVRADRFYGRNND